MKDKLIQFMKELFLGIVLLVVTGAMLIGIFGVIASLPGQGPLEYLIERDICKKNASTPQEYHDC